MKIGPITIDKQGCIDAGMSEKLFAAFVEATELSYLLAIANGRAVRIMRGERQV